MQTTDFYLSVLFRGASNLATTSAPLVNKLISNINTNTLKKGGVAAGVGVATYASLKLLHFIVRKRFEGEDLDDMLGDEILPVSDSLENDIPCTPEELSLAIVPFEDSGNGLANQTVEVSARRIKRRKPFMKHLYHLGRAKFGLMNPDVPANYTVARKFLQNACDGYGVRPEHSTLVVDEITELLFTPTKEDVRIAQRRFGPTRRFRRGAITGRLWDLLVGVNCPEI